MLNFKQKEEELIVNSKFLNKHNANNDRGNFQCTITNSHANRPSTPTPTLPFTMDQKGMAKVLTKHVDGVGGNFQHWKGRQNSIASTRRAFLPYIPTPNSTFTLSLGLKKSKAHIPINNVGRNFQCWEGMQNVMVGTDHAMLLSCTSFSTTLIHCKMYNKL